MVNHETFGCSSDVLVDKADLFHPSCLLIISLTIILFFLCWSPSALFIVLFNGRLILKAVVKEQDMNIV